MSLAYGAFPYIIMFLTWLSIRIKGSKLVILPVMVQITLSIRMWHLHLSRILSYILMLIDRQN